MKRLFVSFIAVVLAVGTVSVFADDVGTSVIHQPELDQPVIDDQPEIDPLENPVQPGSACAPVSCGKAAPCCYYVYRRFHCRRWVCCQPVAVNPGVQQPIPVMPAQNPPIPQPAPIPAPINSNDAQSAGNSDISQSTGESDIGVAPPIK